METCKNCIHWEQDQPGWNKCKKTEHNNALAEVVYRADDDQGLDAWLLTSPDYGCIQHEPHKE